MAKRHQHLVQPLAVMLKAIVKVLSHIWPPGMFIGPNQIEIYFSPTEWKTEQPFKALLEGDMKTVGAADMKGLMEIVMASHSGMTATEFEQEVTGWIIVDMKQVFSPSMPAIGPGG